MCVCMAVHVYVCLTDECVVCSQVKRVLGGNLGRGGALMARLSLSDCPYVAVVIFCGVVRGRFSSLMRVFRGDPGRYIGMQIKEKD